MDSSQVALRPIGTSIYSMNMFILQVNIYLRLCY